MSKNIVFEGWLTKSPPTKRIWRTKWRRRWFALRQSSELPGQYFLDYYADRNCRRLKGTINLDLCEQVDAGMERAGNGTLDPKLRGSVFTVQTQSRTYILEADTEADMGKWVDAICRVCGLRATDTSTDNLETYQTNLNSLSPAGDQQEGRDGTSPYIPISECITGVRAQDPSPFSVATKVNKRASLDHVSDNRNNQMYMSHPHIRINNTDLSENESNLSDEECQSLNASQSNIRDWTVAKTFTKLTISPQRNGDTGPPVPPRPPKTLQKDMYQGPRVQEPGETLDNIRVIIKAPTGFPRGPASPGRHVAQPPRITDDEDECSSGHVSMHYCNLPSLPPAVDRALKPRHSTIQINHLLGQTRLRLQGPRVEMKTDVLQYLDLDLDLRPAKPAVSKPQDVQQKDIVHGKSLSASEADSAYKTVDFLKTEAFNITRQDAEASRNNQL